MCAIGRRQLGDLDRWPPSRRRCAAAGSAGASCCPAPRPRRPRTRRLGRDIPARRLGAVVVAGSDAGRVDATAWRHERRPARRRDRPTACCSMRAPAKMHVEPQPAYSPSGCRRHRRRRRGSRPTA
ncbi:MAG: hypothetical protein MZW92_14145 [Comamonadaceae bacterium]|nr:hypothetical protein [Comamonadaceae bacterium]